MNANGVHSCEANEPRRNRRIIGRDRLENTEYGSFELSPQLGTLPKGLRANGCQDVGTKRLPTVRLALQNHNVLEGSRSLGSLPRIEEALCENDRAIYHVQKATGFDRFWRLYFLLAGRPLQ